MLHPRNEPTPANPAFGEAVAQWRLQMRTEVKKASALPTAMFDACDLMLETRLVETAESMLACLHEPVPSVAQQPAGEQRIEHVDASELQRLPRQLQESGRRSLSVDDGLQPEYLAVLLDTWEQRDGTGRTAAARLLARDFAPHTLDDLEQAAAQLAECTQAALAGDGTAAARLADLYQRIAASAILPPPAGPEGTPP